VWRDELGAEESSTCSSRTPPPRARALEEAGLEVSDELDVLVVDRENRPGSLGEYARRIADAGVNVDLLYATWVVIGADDLERAR
jgi:hypothetical protein